MLALLFAALSPFAAAPAQAQGAPALQNVELTAGDGQLTLTWAAPWSLSQWGGYPLNRRFAVQAKKQSDSTWTNITPFPGETDTSLTITAIGGTALQNGVTYDVRVQALGENQHSNFRSSSWVTKSATPTPLPGQVWSATLNVKDIGGFGVSFGCNNLDVQARKCSNSAVLSDDGPFTVGGTAYEIWDILSTSTGFGVSFDRGAAAGANRNIAGAALQALKFCVGTTAYDIARIGVVGSTSLSWSAGDSINLAIATSCTQQTTQSSDATLSGLSAVGHTQATGTFATAVTLSPTFDAATETYTATVANTITHLKLTATVNESNAMVEYRKGSSGNFTDLTSGTASAAIALNAAGQTTAVTVRVTAQDSTTTKDYTVTITRQAQQTTPTVSLSASPNPVSEGSSVTVTARLSQALSSNVTIPLRLTPVGTTAAGDYGTLSSITITAGQTSGTGVISANQDSDTENERFTVSLGTLPSGVTAGSPSSVQIRIRDDDTPTTSTSATVSLSADPASVLEGRYTFVTATLSAPLSEGVAIPVTVTPGTAEPGDYDVTRPHIIIAAGTTEGSVQIRTTEDTDAKDETFTVALGSNLPPGVTAGSPSSVRIRIEDRQARFERTVHLDVSPNPVPEGQPVTVRVYVRGGLIPDGATIPVRVGRGTSEEGDHGTLSSIDIPRGSSTASGEIWTIRDGDTEDETFSVTIVSPSFLTLGDPSSVLVMIRDGGGGSGGGGGGLPPPGSGNEPPPGSDDEPSTSCSQGDGETLANFYQMTDGEGWDRDENWNSEEPLGEWHGVGTDEDGNVVSLRLADNGLSGDMPTRELRCLSELVELALWGNDDLSGEVPDELVLAVERAALRYLAETLDVNPGWFESYEDPYDFEDWHTGVTTDEDGRVTELDLTGERVTGEIPGNIRELLPRLGGITVTRSSEDGGCALSPEGSSAFGLFLLVLVVFAALVRKRARG